MTDTRLTRAFAGDLEVRSTGDGRTLAGLAVPYDSPATLNEGFSEVIHRGAFARTIAERGPNRVKLLVQHDSTSNPIGRATLLREDTRGLYAEFKVSKTPRGDEALELVRDGTLDSFSVGFIPVREEVTGERGAFVRHHYEAKLLEVSVVSWPAYDGAQITAVRSASTPRLAVARARLQLLEKAGTPWRSTLTFEP